MFLLSHQYTLQTTFFSSSSKATDKLNYLKNYFIKALLRTLIQLKQKKTREWKKHHTVGIKKINDKVFYNSYFRHIIEISSTMHEDDTIANFNSFRYLQQFTMIIVPLFKVANEIFRYCVYVESDHSSGCVLNWLIQYEMCVVRKSTDSKSEKERDTEWK